MLSASTAYESVVMLILSSFTYMNCYENYVFILLIKKYCVVHTSLGMADATVGATRVPKKQATY